MPHDFEVIVLGAGPAGQSAALELARLGRSVCVVEARSSVGGVCLHEGTIPSKSLREAVLAAVAYDARRVLGSGPPERPRADVLLGHVETVIQRELRVIDRALQAAGVQVLHGRARFAGRHEVEVEGHGRLSAESFVVATGSRARRPESVPFDGRHVVDSDELLAALSPLPDRLVIVGGGVVGMEYASVFAIAGVEVHVVFRGPRPLEFVDEDLVDVCVQEFMANGGRVYPRSDVSRVVAGGDGARVELASGQALEADLVLFAVGREGTAGDLGLENVGLEATPWGQIEVGPDHRTGAPHVFAVGDVAGGPTLASVAKVQGRVAARSICGLEVDVPRREEIPGGIFTVPEIAWVGVTESAANQRGLDPVVGRADLAQLARGEIIGLERGLLKLLVDRDSHRILGAGMAGPGAVEHIHAAKVALECEAGLEEFCRGVWNYPALTEGYRVAALAAEAQLTSDGGLGDRGRP